MDRLLVIEVSEDSDNSTGNFDYEQPLSYDKDGHLSSPRWVQVVIVRWSFMAGTLVMIDAMVAPAMVGPDSPIMTKYDEFFFLLFKEQIFLEFN